MDVMPLPKPKHPKTIKRERVNILGLEIDNVDLDEAVERIRQIIKSESQKLVVTPYSEFIVYASQDTRFRQVINQAALTVPDGVSLRAAAAYLNLPAKNWFQAIGKGLKVGWWTLANQDRLTDLKAQVTGVDLMEALCQQASLANWRVFLLGGRGEVAQKAADRLQRQYPHLQIKTHSGSENVESETAEEFSQTGKIICAYKPDLLFVAYGPIRQEKWLDQHLHELDVKVAVGVGGAFDYLSGRRPRAPDWMKKHGLEWLYRLLREPSRLRRQLSIPKFIWMVFQAALDDK